MKWFVLALFAVLAMATEASARQQPDAAPVHAGGGEASLVLPDLGQVSMLGYNSRTLLVLGVGICVLGLLFGLVSYSRLQKLPVHRSMLEVSELIYETCKTYLKTQGRFILILEVFVGLIIALYFGLILHFPLSRVVHHPAVQPRRHRAAATASRGSASASTRSRIRARRSRA